MEIHLFGSYAERTKNGGRQQAGFLDGKVRCTGRVFDGPVDNIADIVQDAHFFLRT
jgi:hypothetical protein